ncbi:type II toxin-antitoxin system ParD family antitoxin (plasmid) [Methylomonas sp. HW2-6]|uniref:type II toxin-antitoxin system ParD family antitoxin n=1 Tax=Methylomonas sp. HW2-6 TaxID=3376687 RepID=UPI003D4A181E
MATMNISLPEPLKEFVDEQVQEHGYSTSSEYVRTLIRKDQVQQAELRIVALMAEGLESGPAVAIDDAYWKAKREALQQKHPGQ